jgi:hypothetical protein
VVSEPLPNPGDSLDTFKAFVLADLTESVLVHDRYHLYDSAELGALDPSAVPPTPLP